MPFVDIFFDEYLPDKGGIPDPERPGYLVDAENVRLTPNGYRPMPVPATVTSAATVGGGATITAGFYAKSSGDIYLGTTSNVYQSDDIGQTWSTVTRATAYSGSVTDWEIFDDLIIATFGIAVKTQRKEHATSTATLFTDLGGGPPNATHVARIRDHLFLGHTNGTNGSRSVQWSSIGDPEDWPTPGSATAIANQAGSQELDATLGDVQAIVGGEKFGLVFQEGGITRFTYVGGSAVYEVDTFEKRVGLGTIIRGKPLKIGDWFYFAGTRGLFRTNGYVVEDIGMGKVHDSHFNDILSHTDGRFQRLHSVAYDERNGVGVLCGTDNSNLNAAVILLLSPMGISRTSHARAPVFEGLESTGINSRSVWYSMASNGALATSSNTNAPSIGIQTGFIELAPGKRVQLTGAHLIGSALDTPTLAFKASDDYSMDVSQTGFTTMTTPARDILFTGRDTARFFSFRITGTQGLDALIRGIRIYYEEGSQR